MKKLFFPLALILIFFPIYAAENLDFSNEAKEKMTRLEAGDYCSFLAEGGYDNWRLPTTTELSGLNKGGGNFWASDREKIEKTYVNDEDKAWFYDFSAKKREKSFVSTRMNVVCVRNVSAKVQPAVTLPVAPPRKKVDPHDKKACELARKERTTDAWKTYLEKFPNGKCAKEAQDAVEASEAFHKAELVRKAEKAQRMNCDTAQRKFPCIDSETGYMWSKTAIRKMTCKQAENYCNELTEGGYSNWRLPTLEMLMTLAGVDSNKFGDTDWYWTSTYGIDKEGRYWCGVNFADGHVSYHYGDSGCGHLKYVRCVRGK